MLNDWITCKSLGGEVDIGYGLLQHSVLEEGGGVSSFETNIELPVSATQSETSELKRLSLQGEAYFRRRCHGSVAPMVGELRTAATSFAVRAGRRDHHVLVIGEKPLGSQARRLNHHRWRNRCSAYRRPLGLISDR